MLIENAWAWNQREPKFLELSPQITFFQPMFKQ